MFGVVEGLIRGTRDGRRRKGEGKGFLVARMRRRRRRSRPRCVFSLDFFRVFGAEADDSRRATKITGSARTTRRSRSIVLPAFSIPPSRPAWPTSPLPSSRTLRRRLRRRCSSVRPLYQQLEDPELIRFRSYHEFVAVCTVTLSLEAEKALRRHVMAFKALDKSSRTELSEISSSTLLAASELWTQILEELSRIEEEV